MKKSLILLIALTSLSYYGHAQQAKGLSKQLNEIDTASVRTLSDSIVKMVSRGYSFYNVEKTGDRDTYANVYVESTLTPQQVKQQIYGDCEKCVKIYFYEYYAGQSVPLEIKGVKRVRLSFISGRFLDLFDIWKGVFMPSATESEVLEKYRSRTIVINGNSVLFTFDRLRSGSGNSWEISNHGQ